MVGRQRLQHVTNLRPSVASCPQGLCAHSASRPELRLPLPEDRLMPNPAGAAHEALACSCARHGGPARL